MFSDLLNLAGNPVSGDEPLKSGPRHWGQLAALAAKDKTANAATAKRCLMEFMAGDWVEVELMRQPFEYLNRRAGTRSIQAAKRPEFSWVCARCSAESLIDFVTAHSRAVRPYADGRWPCGRLGGWKGRWGDSPDFRGLPGLADS
jgi:hypothetical protein